MKRGRQVGQEQRRRRTPRVARFTTVALTALLLASLLPLIPGVPSLPQGVPLAPAAADAHGNHPGPPDDAGVWAYCFLDTMRNVPPGPYPGGGTEMQFGYRISPQFLKLIQ